MPLKLSAAYHTATGPRERNEDFAGFVTPADEALLRKGFAAVIADGVSGAAGGREAAEHCARNVLADYFSTPDTWEVQTSLEKIYQALNRWVQSQARARKELVGMATTLTSLVLRGNVYSFAHVGDTRLYLLRNGALQKLTGDHVWQRPEMEHVLTRAIGLDTQLVVDHGMGPLKADDVFALLSDGAWARLAETDLQHMLADVTMHKSSPEQSSRLIVDTALTLGGTDNTTALVVQVHATDENLLRDLLREQQPLPVPPPLKAGEVIDGLTVQALLHESRITRLYQVRSTEGRELVLKTLTSLAAQDAHERLAFAHEAWLAKRAVARYFAQSVPPLQAPTALYALSTFHAGQTVAQSLAAGRHFTVPEAIKLGMDLARALGALHRRSITHRDVKPENIHLGDDGQLRLLDLGVAISGFDAPELSSAQRAGTPSYLAPELFAVHSDDDKAHTPTPITDLYAWGVTIYQVLARRYPYGEVEPFQTPRFGEPEPASRTRPDVPGWLDNLLLKAVDADPRQRFETAEELLLALEQGPLATQHAPRKRPLVTRNVLRTWQWVAVLSLVINAILLYQWILHR
jgi:serine/threonine protein phosphatase PrpC